ncbi:enoyl-CoA hydratase/isomerase family protein [Nocardia sp. NPDC048505]|uniref:enoyl-CoA hydratase/isomerase family protein n=1 Tax=unclassified Nocardia TaxID=2637762 RepID=UPI0034009387
MTSALLQTEFPAEGVAVLTLNRPEKKNALSIALRDSISDELDALAKDERVRVVVLIGAGAVFSAGFDLGEFTSSDPIVQQTLWPSSDRFHHTLLRFPLPVLAAIDGPALAGGFDMATLCDIRICSQTAVFGHPEQSWADIVYGPLHDLLGGATARDLCFTGRRVEAAEALRIGLVSRVVPGANLRSVAVAMASDIARAPRQVLIRTKAKALARSTVSPHASTLSL